MKQLVTTVFGLMLAVTAGAQDRFAITMRVDSAIASVPQTVYLYSMIEKQMQLHDSVCIDSVHRAGTFHGTVPYEYNVNILFPKRGPQVVPVVVNNGDSIGIHVADEDDGFHLRYVGDVTGSPSTLEMFNYQRQRDSIRQEYLKRYSELQLYSLTDGQRDSIKAEMKKHSNAMQWFQLGYANTGKSPYTVLSAASNVFYDYRARPNEKPYTEADVDAMMNTLLKRFPDYPPMKAFVNDSTLGSYMSAETFAIFEEFNLRRYSYRFQHEEDSLVKPLKVGDYMNLPLHEGSGSNVNDFRGKYVLVDFWASWCQPCMVQMASIRQAAQDFRDDLVVCLVGMDENRKQWWSTIKEYDLRNKDLTQTDRPYKINHYRAYDDKKGKKYPDVQRLDIQAIPHNYFVDRSGKIIAKNISIALMVDKLQQLLEKEKQQ